MDAAVIIAYKSPIIFKTVESLVKYLPNDLPIYLIDQAKPDMVEEKERMHDAAGRFPGRVEVCELFVHERIAFAPWALVRFLEIHPEVEHVLKVDDDVFIGSKVYEGMKEAYDMHPDTLFSCAFCPIQIWGLSLLVHRCNIPIDVKLLNPETILNSIVHNPALATEVWKQTVPPSKILEGGMKQEPRFMRVPLFRVYIDAKADPTQRADFMINQYFAHRDTIIQHCSNLDGETTSDEINYQRTRQRTNRPIIMDTWSLAYHFSGAPWFGHAWEHDWPLIKDVEF